MEVNLKRRKSMIWNSFTILNDATASCNYCQHVLSYRSTIGNLKKHLDRKHSTTVKLPKQIFPLSSNEISESSEPYTVLYVVSDEESQPPTLYADDSDIPTTQTSSQESISTPHVQGTADQEDENSFREKRRSTIWNYFTPQNRFKAACNLCQKHLSYKTSISNLRKHYQKKHTSTRVYENISYTSHEMREVEQNESPTCKTVNSIHKVDEFSLNSPTKSSHSTISTSSIEKNPKICKISPSTVSKVSCSNLKTNKVDEILLKMITTDLLPIALVQDNGFKEFTRALNPFYTLPTEKKLSTELIPTKFKAITLKVHQIIKKVKSVTLTTDCWTSYSNESFIRVLAHFISDDYECKSILLAVKSCNLPLSGKCLSELLENVIEQWDLKGKILLVISDNVTDLQDEDLQWPHLKCIVTTIGSIIQDSLKQVEPLLNTISDIVSIVKKKIGIGQLKHFLKVYEKITPCTSKHWTSVLYMLKGVKEFKEEIWATVSSFGEENLSGWTYEKFELVEELIQILEPMESITKVVKKEKITLSLIIVLCNGLLDNYNSSMMTKSFSIEIEPVVKEIVENLNARFSNLESISTLLISSFLDPRFKHVGFSNDSLVNRAKSLVSENFEVLKEDKTEKLRSISLDLDNEPHLIWDSFDKKVATFDSSANCGKSRATIELDRYLEEPLLNRNEDPLQWWKTNAYNFPFLSDIIKLKFGSVATAFPYKMCCKNEQSLTERRNSVPSNNIEQIMFIGYNFSVGTG